MKDILHDIITNKRKEVERQKEAVKLQTLLSLSNDRLERPSISMRKALEESTSGIIAEFKRKSPSKGWLYPNAKVESVIPFYQENGAAACSILTDSVFFGGSLGDLKKARQYASLPLLRKDFIIDSYQLYQARAMGADGVLLIAACLKPEECEELALLAHALNLEVLLEIHSESELDHLNPYIDMLGVNNRNLGTFHTDVNNSFRLAKSMQQKATERKCNPLLISESGLSDPKTVMELRKAGFKGFLMGETFMKTENPGETLQQFIGELSC